MEYMERQLIMLSKNGDTSAFGQIFDLYREKIFRMASRMLKSKAESEDVVQETFIRLYLNLNRFDESKSFSTWLYTIGKNVCLDMIRKRRNNVSLDEMRDGDDGVDRYELLDAGLPGPEELAIRSETRTIVGKVIESLPEKYRQLFVGSYLKGMSLEELSLAHNLPLNTVKSRMNRGRSYVKRKWGKSLLALLTALLPLASVS